MRTRNVVSVVLAVAAISMSSGTQAGLLTEYADLCGVMPPPEAQQAVTVPVDLIFLSAKNIQKYCGGRRPIFHKITACAYPHPTAADPDGWQVLIENDLSDRDESCVETYEAAHMPPNNWMDWRWEWGAHGPH